MAPKSKPPKKTTSKKADAAAAAGVETVFSGLAIKDDGGRSATGILVSEVRARDIKIASFSLALHGNVLVEDTTIELNNGGRYGLLGRNGM